MRGPESSRHSLAPRVQIGSGLPGSQFHCLPAPHVTDEGTQVRPSAIGASPDYIFFPEPSTYVAQTANAWYTGSSPRSAAASWQRTLVHHGLRTPAEQQQFTEWSGSQTGRLIDEFRKRSRGK